MQQGRMYPVDEAIRAQTALRTAAGLGAEQFPIQAFVGMKSDTEIAAIIQASSSIQITPEEIAANYATPEERHGHEG